MFNKWIFPADRQVLIITLGSVLAPRCAGLRKEVITKTFFAASCHSRKTLKIVRQFYKLMKLVS